MATLLRDHKKQDFPIKREPKFGHGYEFYFPSTHFGKRWAKKSFGSNFISYFLIGSVKKPRITKKKDVEYDVFFAFDNSRYVYSEELVSKLLSCTVSVEIEERGNGYVMFSAAAMKNFGHGDFGNFVSFQEFLTSLLAFWV